VTQPITVQNATLLKCYQNGGINYNLTGTASDYTTTGVTFAYYLNAADANAGNTNNCQSCIF
jgi:hypothetical protein